MTDWSTYFEAHEAQRRTVATRSKPVEVVVHPVTEAWPENFNGMPSGARTLWKCAERAGWDVRAGYTRTETHEYVQVAVRWPGTTGRARGAVVYRRAIDGRWTAWTMIFDHRRVSITEWKSALTSNGDSDALFV